MSENKQFLFEIFKGYAPTTSIRLARMGWNTLCCLVHFASKARDVLSLWGGIGAGRAKATAYRAPKRLTAL